MSEKGPNIRIVGGATKQEKESERQKIKRAIFDHVESLSEAEKDTFAKLEYPKSEEQIKLINFANAETSRLMREAGVEPYDISLDNVHIIIPELYEKLAGNLGVAQAKRIKEVVLINAEGVRNSPLVFALSVFHEFLHLKAHLSVEIQSKDGEEHKTVYRMGVTAESSQKNRFEAKGHSHFKALHEAIVTETEKRMVAKVLSLPECKEEKEWLDSAEAVDLRKHISHDDHIPEEDILWVDSQHINTRGIYFETFGYHTQTATLRYVYAEIQKQFPEKFKDVDAVHKVFLNANFTGKLLEIARLVEGTFGEGSFRVLGDMNTSSESGVLTLDALKKARLRQK